MTECVCVILLCTIIGFSVLVAFSGAVSAALEDGVLSKVGDGLKKAVESGYSLSLIVDTSLSVCCDDPERTS